MVWAPPCKVSNQIETGKFSRLNLGHHQIASILPRREQHKEAGAANEFEYGNEKTACLRHSIGKAFGLHGRTFAGKPWLCRFRFGSCRFWPPAWRCKESLAETV